MITLQDILKKKAETAKEIINVQKHLVFLEGKHQSCLELEHLLAEKLDNASKGLPPVAPVPPPQPPVKEAIPAPSPVVENPPTPEPSSDALPS